MLCHLPPSSTQPIVFETFSSSCASVTSKKKTGREALHVLYYYGNALEKRGQKRSKSWFPSARGCGGYGRRCGQTEAATEQLIAAPAWPSYGTRPPLRNLCVLRTVRAAGSGFRGRHRALCAGRGVLGRFFGLREAARPRTWRYAIAHCIRDKVHITNSWHSSRTCPCASL